MKNESKLYQTPAIIVLPLADLDVLAASDNDASWDPLWVDSYVFH